MYKEDYFYKSGYINTHIGFIKEINDGEKPFEYFFNIWVSILGGSI
jgi:hypothetical protein